MEKIFFLSNLKGVVIPHHNLTPHFMEAGSATEGGGGLRAKI